ncbi:MAG: hypothetical protein QOI83_1715 [Streptomycetaceae bacterium]|nr:hypothetical protein [Streptomycetaceae bacterium]
MRRAEVDGGGQLAVVDVDGNDPRRAGEPRARDRGTTDPAAADHRDALPAVHPCGIDRGAEAGHHPAAEQPGDLRPHGRIVPRALAGVHERLLGERTDA